MRTRPFATRSLIAQVLVVAALLGLWQLADTIWAWDKVLIPNPLEVATAFREHWRELAANGLVTLGEAILGFVIGSVVGVTLAGLAVMLPVIGRFALPYAVVIKAVPIVVLAPLLVMWFGDGLSSKVVMAASAAFFPILVNGVTAFTSVEHEWCSLLSLHGANRWQIFWMLRVPHALPALFSGMKVATSLAMVGAVVGEFTGSSNGLGHLITTSTYYLNTDLVFAGVIVLGASGVGFYGLVALLQRTVVFWRTER